MARFPTWLVRGLLVSGICVCGIPGFGRQSTDVDPLAVERIAAARQAVEDNPNSYEARRDLALALHRAGLKDAALAEFEANARVNPGPQAQLDLALAYASHEQRWDAEQAYEKLLEIAPNHPSALYNLASLAFDRGETGKSIALFRRALAASPDHLMVQYRLADALRYSGRNRDAYDAYAAALRMTPRSRQEQEAVGDSLYRMATLQIGWGDAAKGEKLLRQLLAAWPEHDSAHYAYAQLLMVQDRVEEGRQHLETHMRIEAAKETTGPMATTH